MKVTVKQANGFNFTKNKLYTVIREDWDQSTMTVIDDLGREVTGTIWMFSPAGNEFNSTVCLSREELRKMVA